MDWIGGRYFWGDQLGSLLTGDCFTLDNDTEHRTEWDDSEDITFRVPENIAWTIRDNLEAEDSWMPCAGSELSAKLRQFCDRIV